MSTNIRKSKIKEINRKFFKTKEDRETLAKLAGSTGFGRRRMDKELKNIGYNLDKRKKIMSSVLSGSAKPKISKPETKDRRSIINRARDTGALQQDAPRRANISALGSVGNQSGGFANSPKPVVGPVKSGMPSPPTNNQPKPGPGQGLVNF